MSCHAMKLVRSVSIAAMVAVVVSGCASSPTPTAPSSPAGGGAATTPTAPAGPSPSVFCGAECQEQLALSASPESVACTVGISWNSALHPYGAKHTQGIPEFAAQYFPGMKVVATEAQGDGNKQSGQVDDLIAQGIDVLIVSPADAAGLTGAVDRAREAGIKIIAADRSVDTTIDTYIGSDNVEAGEVAGKAVTEVLGDKGNVVELAGSLGASPTIDRGSGFRATLGAGVTILDSQTANYDKAQGLKVMEDLLQRFGSGQIQAVFTHNDQMAFGAVQAIQEAGRAAEIKVFGIDAEPGALEAIQKGEMAATVAYPAVVNESVLAAAKLCSGEPIDERIVLDSTLIDSSNVQDFIED